MVLPALQARVPGLDLPVRLLVVRVRAVGRAGRRRRRVRVARGEGLPGGVLGPPTAACEGGHGPPGAAQHTVPGRGAWDPRLETAHAQETYTCDTRRCVP